MEIVTPIDTACPNDISGSPEIADAFRRAAVHDHQIRNPAGRDAAVLVGSAVGRVNSRRRSDVNGIGSSIGLPSYWRR
jgi:hypothetical protein